MNYAAPLKDMMFVIRELAGLEDVRRLPGFEGPVQVRQFQGGQSNPTFHLATGAGDYVLRKKPPGQLLKGAHAVEREYRVLTALQGSGVPVPRTRLLCEDPEVIGTPFFVMDHVPGRVLYDRVAEVGTPDALPVLRQCAKRFAGTPFLPFAVSVAIARISGTQD